MFAAKIFLWKKNESSELLPTWLVNLRCRGPWLCGSETNAAHEERKLHSSDWISRWSRDWRGWPLADVYKSLGVSKPRKMSSGSSDNRSIPAELLQELDGRVGAVMVVFWVLFFIALNVVFFWLGKSVTSLRPLSDKRCRNLAVSWVHACISTFGCGYRWVACSTVRCQFRFVAVCHLSLLHKLLPHTGVWFRGTTL